MKKALVRSGVIALVLCLIVTGFAFAGENLMKNGGFETDDNWDLIPDGYRFYAISGGSASCVMVQEARPESSGRYSVKLVSLFPGIVGFDNDTMEHWIVRSTNKGVTWSFWIKPLTACTVRVHVGWFNAFGKFIGDGRVVSEGGNNYDYIEFAEDDVGKWHEIVITYEKDEIPAGAAKASTVWLLLNQPEDSGILIDDAMLVEGIVK